jgi:hypothetical protein
MGPAAWADKASLRLKKKAYNGLYMTSHWPSNGVTLFPGALKDARLPDDAPKAKNPLRRLPDAAKTVEAMQVGWLVSC